MKTLKKILIIHLFLFPSFPYKLIAQGGIGINSVGAAPNSNAILDISSTNKGVLTPRMSLAERNSIVAPAAGLLIYQVSGTSAFPQGYYYHNGTKWNKVEEQLVGTVQQPSTILAGDGFTVSTISTGKNLIDYSGSAFTNSPTVLLTPEYTEVGTSPVIGNYCQPSFTLCNTGGASVFITTMTLNSPANTGVAPDLKLTGANIPASCQALGYADKTATALTNGCMGVGNDAFLRVVRDLSGTLDYVTFWIDYNQDGFFTSSEIESSGAPFIGTNPNNNAVTFKFLVGNTNAFNGNTFMRIMTRPSSVHNNPCFITGGSDNGEAEDFTVCISGGLPAAYANDHNYCNISNITNTQTTVNCYNRFGSITDRKYHFKIISND
jgi:GEVED domain